MKKIFTLLALFTLTTAMTFAQKIELENMTKSATGVSATNSATHGLPFAPSEGCYFTATGGTVNQNVNFTTAGNYTVKIKGYHDYDNRNSLSLSIGGTVVKSGINFIKVNWGGGNYSSVTPSETTFSISIANTGSQEVKLVFDRTTGGCLAADFIEFTPSSTPPPPAGLIEAESMVKEPNQNSNNTWNCTPAQATKFSPTATPAGVKFSGLNAARKTTFNFTTIGKYVFQIRGYHLWNKQQSFSLFVGTNEVLSGIDFNVTSNGSDYATLIPDEPTFEFDITATGTQDVILKLTNHTGGEVIVDWIQIKEKGNTTFVDTQKGIDVSVYPNPSKGLVTVNWGDLEVGSCTVFDAQGRTIQLKEYHNSDNQTQLNIPQSGIYFIKLRSGKIKEVKKVIVL